MRRIQIIPPPLPSDLNSDACRPLTWQAAEDLESLYEKKLQKEAKRLQVRGHQHDPLPPVTKIVSPWLSIGADGDKAVWL